MCQIIKPKHASLAWLKIANSAAALPRKFAKSVITLLFLINQNKSVFVWINIMAHNANIFVQSSTVINAPLIPNASNAGIIMHFQMIQVLVNLFNAKLISVICA